MARDGPASIGVPRAAKTIASHRDPGPLSPRTFWSRPRQAFAWRKPCYTPPPMRHFLDFERPIAELEGKIEELRHLATSSDLNIADEVGRLEAQANRLLRQTYARLTPWQKVLVARHPDRPHCLDYIAGLITDFVPLAGDRLFAEDAAVVGGIGRFRGRSVMVLGT